MQKKDRSSVYCERPSAQIAQVHIDSHVSSVLLTGKKGIEIDWCLLYRSQVKKVHNVSYLYKIHSDINMLCAKGINQV